MKRFPKLMQTAAAVAFLSVPPVCALVVLSAAEMEINRASMAHNAGSATPDTPYLHNNEERGQRFN